MSILLPSSPQPADGTRAMYLDWGGTLRPIFGGALQKLNRLGDRFAIDVTLPPLRTEEVGRRWTASLVLAQRQGAILAFPQLGLNIGDPGNPVVDGGDQAGSSLRMRGFAAGYAIRFGQFFSILHGGRHYLTMAAADGSAGADGKVTLPIAPMLRMRPANGAVCAFAAPQIEGLLQGDSREWTLSSAMTTGLTFQIQEVR